MDDDLTMVFFLAILFPISIANLFYYVLLRFIEHLMKNLINYKRAEERKKKKNHYSQGKEFLFFDVGLKFEQWE